MAFKILTVVGTRPNFIKVTQFGACLNDPDAGLEHRLLHTGQHYDEKMSKIFFEQFQLQPDFWLNVPPGTPNTQIAHTMIGIEQVMQEQYRPDLLMVVGDVNSTLAAALTANKMGVPIAHVESGLRSQDRTMPEEINRILTDEIADYCLVTEQSGLDNLTKEGKQQDRIAFVGNTMIDTLVAFETSIQASGIQGELGVEAGNYALMTMHRPATVDHRDGLEKLIEVLRLLAPMCPLVFSIHPRTMNNLKKFDLERIIRAIPQLILAGPMDYFSFQKLVSDARFVITDSGGIQEETTFLRVPCLTLRANTERPSTTVMGTNTLAPFEPDAILQLTGDIVRGSYKSGAIPPKWDGKATQRIAEFVKTLL